MRAARLAHSSAAAPPRRPATLTPAFRVQRGSDPPTTHEGAATLSPSVSLSERGGCVFLSADAPQDGGALAPLVPVWIDGVQARAGVSYVLPAETRVSLDDAASTPITISYDVAASGAGGDALTSLAAAAFAAGASDEAKQAMKDAGLL